MITYANGNNAGARKMGDWVVGKNRNLHSARREKNDDFYTQLEDIEQEMEHYEHHFRGKVVYCNADDPRDSNFFFYFSENFERLGLKRLITTCYRNSSPTFFSEDKDERSVYLVYEGDKNNNKIVDDEEVDVELLQGDGDFRSPECIEFLKQADIVVTNPPFSLFKQYMAQLIKYNKKFLIIGNMNAIAYKEIFPLIKDNKIWQGCISGAREYRIPDSMEVKNISRVDEKGRRYTKLGNTCWFTNLEHSKRNEEIMLYKKYKAEEYPHYDNYDAIEVGKVVEIPRDWDGVMGVPISFLERYNPDQFEIVGLSPIKGLDGGLFRTDSERREPLIKGKRKFARIFIRRIQP